VSLVIELDRSEEILVIARDDAENRAFVADVQGNKVWLLWIRCTWPSASAGWTAADLTYNSLTKYMTAVEVVKPLSELIDDCSYTYEMFLPSNICKLPLSREELGRLTSILSDMYLEYAP